MEKCTIYTFMNNRWNFFSWDSLKGTYLHDAYKDLVPVINGIFKEEPIEYLMTRNIFDDKT